MKETEEEPLSGIELFMRFASIAVIGVVVSLILAGVVWYYTGSTLTAGIVVAVVYVVANCIVMTRSKLLP